ncbi:MAG: hypothetical protein KAW00_05515 [Dehalococcoidia bacterium]|nr:hypothetical protein [Dehalococcoidia bacterium]
MNRTPPETAQKDKPSEQALLAEYEACQLEANASGSYVFQSGVIYFVTTLALAGTAISYLINADGGAYRCVLVILLGVFSILALRAWKNYAARQHFIRDVMYDRMRMIQRKLSLRKDLYVHFLDEASKDTLYNKAWLPLGNAERKTLWERYADNPGRKLRGFKWVKWVVWSAIIAWVILMLLVILLEVSRHFGCIWGCFHS